MQYGTRVKVTAPKHVGRPLYGLNAAFEGQVGIVVDVEQDGCTRMYRVRFDTPVNVEHVGRITDDLWSREFLRKTSR